MTFKRKVILVRPLNINNTTENCNYYSLQWSPNLMKKRSNSCNYSRGLLLLNIHLIPIVTSTASENSHVKFSITLQTIFFWKTSHKTSFYEISKSFNMFCWKLSNIQATKTFLSFVFIINSIPASINKVLLTHCTK